MNAKLSSDGTNGAEQEKTFSDLLMSYALAIQELSLACNRLLIATSQLGLRKSPRVHLSVVCGRPVSGFSYKAGAKLRVVGK
jgi:hypothetical protein